MREFQVSCGGRMHRIVLREDGKLAFPDHKDVPSELQEFEVLQALGCQEEPSGCARFLRAWRRRDTVELWNLSWYGELPPPHRPPRHPHIYAGGFISRLPDNGIEDLACRELIAAVRTALPQTARLIARGWFDWRAREPADRTGIMVEVHTTLRAFTRVLLSGYNLVAVYGSLFAGVSLTQEFLLAVGGRHYSTLLLNLEAVEPRGKLLTLPRQFRRPAVLSAGDKQTHSETNTWTFKHNRR